MGMSAPVAAMLGAGFAFPGAGWLFQHVNWQVDAHELMAVLGSNGRGKSTMIRCFMGWLRLAEGSVRHSAEPAFVPQHHSPVFAYSVLDMVLMGRARRLGMMRLPGARDRAAALEALERVGAAHLAERDFPTLSGGEQQLVLVARAIIGQTGLLVLDEPGASLDLANQARMVSIVRELCDEGWAAIMITHQPDHALEAADKVLLMDGSDGGVFGVPRLVMTDESLTRLYGIPTRIISYETGGTERLTVASSLRGRESAWCDGQSAKERPDA
ncbi:ABC transporter ATP-binding protein [Propionibacterium australiense]|uniref:ABC transporter ATP-binding protein n=2 Tax=Propionibacterium australiense TaxID=119981 RepID=A0A8B3FSR1_9ACTN|nr:ABC transporter ATP-binding protein [Propionibacterium australiense]